MEDESRKLLTSQCVGGDTLLPVRFRQYKLDVVVLGRSEYAIPVGEPVKLIDRPSLLLSRVNKRVSADCLKYEPSKRLCYLGRTQLNSPSNIIWWRMWTLVVPLHHPPWIPDKSKQSTTWVHDWLTDWLPDWLALAWVREIKSPWGVAGIVLLWVWREQSCELDVKWPSFSGNCGLIDCYAAADVRKLIECLRKCHPHITYFLMGWYRWRIWSFTKQKFKRFL